MNPVLQNGCIVGLLVVFFGLWLAMAVSFHVGSSHERIALWMIEAQERDREDNQ